MKITIWKTAALVLLITLCNRAKAVDHPDPALSAAESAMISRQIATLRSSADRDVARHWSNAKKVAELICRPVALPLLRKQAKGADRVFLGTDSSQSLTLENNRRLTGSGQVRTPQGWKNFSFTCNLDPTTGKIVDFKTVPK